MSEGDEEGGSQGLQSAIDDILDQYRFSWEPENRVKFKKDLAGFVVGVGVSKPHHQSPRMRLTVKPPDVDCLWRPERFVQKVLVLPQQRFAALYSRKLALGILRCQFVVGYFFDRKVPTLDYRLSTKWNDGLRFKRKEYFQPTKHLLLRAKWNLDMQLPDVEGHLGGAEGSLQVPVDVEYGSLYLSVTQLDWVCDLDGLKDARQNPLAWLTQKKAALRAAPAAPPALAAPAPPVAPAAIPGERIVWPWQR